MQTEIANVYLGFLPPAHYQDHAFNVLIRGVQVTDPQQLTLSRLLPELFSHITNSSNEFLAFVVSSESEASKYWVGRSRVPLATHGPPSIWRDPLHGFVELCRLDAYRTCHQHIPPVDAQHPAVVDLQALQDLPAATALYVIYIYYIQTVSLFG